MKKSKLSLSLLCSIFLISCGSNGNGSNIQNNYTHLTDYINEGKTYNIFRISNMNNAYFYYSNLFGESYSAIWTINYTYTYTYFINDTSSLSLDVQNDFYNILLNNKELLEEMTNLKLNLNRPNTKENRELTFTNPTNQNMSIVTLDLYLPFRIDEYTNSNQKYTYFIEVPCYTYHLKKINNTIEDYKTGEMIDYELFTSTFTAK